MIKFTEDPLVLQRLYKRYDYLMDLPCKLEGMYLEEAEHLATLETDDLVGFVLGYPCEDCRVERNHFTLLSADENLAIRRYRLLKPVVPWPQPIIGITSDSNGVATVSGTHRVTVMMNSIGTAQLWWGGDVAVLWEAFLEGDIQQRNDYEAVLNQLWTCCESFLKQQGVQHVYTYEREPSVDAQWYKAFLTRRGYIPIEQRKITVMKALD